MYLQQELATVAVGGARYFHWPCKANAANVFRNLAMVRPSERWPYLVRACQLNEHPLFKSKQIVASHIKGDEFVAALAIYGDLKSVRSPYATTVANHLLGLTKPLKASPTAIIKTPPTMRVISRIPKPPRKQERNRGLMIRKSEPFGGALPQITLWIIALVLGATLPGGCGLKTAHLYKGPKRPASEVAVLTCDTSFFAPRVIVYSVDGIQGKISPVFQTASQRMRFNGKNNLNCRIEMLPGKHVLEVGSAVVAHGDGVITFVARPGRKYGLKVAGPDGAKRMELFDYANKKLAVAQTNLGNKEPLTPKEIAKLMKGNQEFKKDNERLKPRKPHLNLPKRPGNKIIGRVRYGKEVDGLSLSVTLERQKIATGQLSTVTFRIAQRLDKPVVADLKHLACKGRISFSLSVATGKKIAQKRILGSTRYCRTVVGIGNSRVRETSPEIMMPLPPQNLTRGLWQLRGVAKVQINNKTVVLQTPKLDIKVN